ncbi:MAG: GntR family transcriptional regulator [Acidobacteria bacterium]|nr:GntR family transcriptional regulator [Acidobacteriota bacterium]
MDLLIDPASAVPIYAQVVEQIRRLVAAGGLDSGDKLPSVRDLAASLRINRNTAAKAYQLLETEGVLKSRAGQGTFIATGGSRWSAEERLRRVAASLDRALVEAYHLEIPLTELPAILSRRIKAFRDDRP